MAQVTTIELTMLINQIKEKNPESVVKEAFTIFLKLIENILKVPSNEKFKVINKGNKTVVEKWLICEGIVNLALAVGYEESDAVNLYFTGEIENLQNLKQSIQSYFEIHLNETTKHPETNSGTSSQAYLGSTHSLNSKTTPEPPASKEHEKVEKPTEKPSDPKPEIHPQSKDAEKTEENKEAQKEPEKKEPKLKETPKGPEKITPKGSVPTNKLGAEVHKPKPVEIKDIHQVEPDYQLEWSGSSYSGPIKDGWFEGKGRFRFPSGVIYEGEFHKGEFHGKGTLIFTNGGKYKATWNRGKAVDGEYEYYDGLIYDSQNWNYCQIPDRRFYTEIKEGLRPAGATLMVNDAKGPKNMAPGTYDVGEGYYDRNKNMVYSYEGEEKYVPEDNDIGDIIDKYRYNPSNS